VIFLRRDVDETMTQLAARTPAAALPLNTASRWMVVALVAFILWLPLSTPLILVGFQYLGVNPGVARALLLVKDVASIASLLVLFAAYGRDVAWNWFDVAAFAFGVLVIIYSLVPLLIGSSVGLSGVVSAARSLGFPVVLYLLGRILATKVEPLTPAINACIAAGAFAAAFALAQYFLLPPLFLGSSYDLVAFVRDVQGFPTATNLWDISILAQYTGYEQGQFLRAVGPFTHPVGAAHFLVLPMTLSFAWALLESGARRTLAGFLTLGLAIALLVTFSRGSWMAGALAIAITGIVLGRPKPTLVALMVTGFVLLTVSPFNLAVTSAFSGTDASTGGHIYAIQQNVDLYLEHPLGAGVGTADKMGATSIPGTSPASPAENSQSDNVGIGENMYLSLLLNVGPLGFVVFLAWIAGAALAVVGKIAGKARTRWREVVVVAVLVGYLASAMTSAPMMRFTTSGAFWLLFGLAVPTVVVRSGRSLIAPLLRR
jgi:hypothetical protein